MRGQLEILLSLFPPYKNVEKAYTYGGTFGVAGKFERLELNANYAYTVAKQYSGDDIFDLTFRVPHRITASFSYMIPVIETQISIDGEWNSPQTSSDTTFEESLTKSEESLIQKEHNVRLEELQKNYKSYVLKSIAAKKVYPMAARRKELTGKVKVHVVINADGSVSLLELYSSCDYDLINDAALSAVKRAVPFKKMPSEMTSLDFIFTIDFELS